jgi:RNA polymerase sigma-70 factor (ECF subfamily)
MASGGERFPRIARDREGLFLKLFLENEQRIFAYILALVPVRSDADDLLQETAAVMWRKLDEFAYGTDFLAWAISIARYQILAFRKTQGRSRVRFGDVTYEALADQIAPANLGSDDRRDALEGCLKKLNDKDRELIRLRYQPDATVQEVADRVGRSLKAVYRSLSRIHSQLLLCIRKSLAEGGLE